MNDQSGQSGGVNISGSVGSVGGDIVGRDKIANAWSQQAADAAFQPLLDAIGAVPPEVKADAEHKLAALKQEAAKGKDANDSMVARLVEGLVELVPGAATTVVSAFAGPVTGFVLDKLRGK